jgi:hypothetical protein
VVVDDLQAWRVVITESADVRVRGNLTLSGFAILDCTNSRVEVVECTFHSWDAIDQFCGWPIDPTGQPGARVDGGALHAARSSFHGGNGGDSWCPDTGLIEPGGAGGPGIVLWNHSAQLLLTGIPANELVGGIGGWAYSYGFASDGAGLNVSTTCSARVSGVTIASQSTSGTGSITTAVPSDPTVRLIGVPTPGANLTLRVNAPAGSSAHMRVGAQPVVVPVGGLEEDDLVARAQTFALGTVPPTGVLGFNLPIGAHWPRGTTIFAQALVTLPGGEVRRTHSIPIVVR